MIKYLLQISLILFGLSLNSCFKDEDDKDNDIVTTGDERFTGVNESDPVALANAPAAVPPALGNLPSSYSLNFPPPIQQGAEGSCAAFASAYAVMSYHKGGPFGNGSNIDKEKVYSPEYVFNQVRVDPNDCSKGSYLITTSGNKGILDLLMEKGVCTWEEMPYSDGNGCSEQPSSSQNSAASNNKLLRYEVVSTTSINHLKSFIYGGKPIIVVCPVGNDFMSLASDDIWYDNSDIVGLHAMVIIGYDNDKEAFKLQNSWGTGWADGGYGWMAYSSFDDLVREAYITYPKVSNNNNNNNNSDCDTGDWGYFKIINNHWSDVSVYIDRQSGNLDPDFIIQSYSTRLVYDLSLGTHDYQIWDVNIIEQAQFRLDNGCDTATVEVY